MTLIITVATRDFVFQVADTQLTRYDGTFYSDKTVKTTVVHCSDSKLLISYTGLAEIEGMRTDKWLVGKLKDTKVWDKTFPETVKFLENVLTKTMSRDKGLVDHSLLLVIAGLGINKGIRDVAVALVTNNEEDVPKRGLIEHKKIDGVFGSVFYQPSPNFTWYISVDGAVDLSPEIKSLRRKISSKLLKVKTNEQLDEIMYYLVLWIRLQRKSKDVGHLIGDDCTVAHIGSDYKGSLFFFSNDKKIRRYPNIVSKEYSFVDFVKE